MKKSSRFRKIRKLEGQRWFIWTLVAIIVILTSLSIYVYSTIFTDAARVIGLPIVSSFNAAPRNIYPSDIAGTTWTPVDTRLNAAIEFLNTKKNDPKHAAYDYRILVDSKVQEVGYWQISNGQIIPKPTSVLIKAQQIKTIVISGNSLSAYAYNYIFVSHFVKTKVVTISTQAN